MSKNLTARINRLEAAAMPDINLMTDRELILHVRRSLDELRATLPPEEQAKFDTLTTTEEIAAYLEQLIAAAE